MLIIWKLILRKYSLIILIFIISFLSTNLSDPVKLILFKLSSIQNEIFDITQDILFLYLFPLKWPDAIDDKQWERKGLFCCQQWRLGEEKTESVVAVH